LADNVTLPGSGAVVASDDIGSGVQAQRIKPVWGADGTGTDTQVSQPLPVQATVDTSQMSAAGTIVTPLFAPINVNTSGSNSIVAAVTGKSIRVLGYVMVADAAVTATWLQGVTAISGVMSLAANGGVAAPFSPVGHFQTAAGAALNLSLGGAVGVRGHLVYVTV
jgi:hypothetical protein